MLHENNADGLSDINPNDRVRSEQEINQLNQSIDAWQLRENIFNSNNADNIAEARNRIIDCFMNFGNTLDLRALNIFRIPTILSLMDHIESLSLRLNPNIELSSYRNLAGLVNLRNLILFSNNLPTIADHIPRTLTNLSSLSLGNNGIIQFPENVLNFPNLQSLSLRHNQISSIPEGISRLQNLQNFDISNNQLVSIPVNQLNSISSLRELDLSRNFIQTDNGEIRRINIEGISDLNGRILLNRDLLRSAEVEFLDNLIRMSGFNDEELSSSNSLLGDVKEGYEIQNSLKLGRLMEYFSDAESGEGNNNMVKRDIIRALRRLTNSRMFEQMADDSRRSLSRELLVVLWQIYQGRENEELMSRCHIIARESLSNCEDRNILMIFQIKNLCNKLDRDKVRDLLESDRKDQFFSYLSQQIIFLKITDLASIHVKNMLRVNPNFSEDVEVYLNYVRVFNNEFGRKFSLKLPLISVQNYFENHPDYSINPSELEKFDAMYNASQRGDFKPLFEFYAQEIAEDSFSNILEKIPEINQQSFVTLFKEEINGIALDFLMDLETIRSSHNELEDESVKKIIASDLKQIQIRTLKDLILRQLVDLNETQRLKIQIDDNLREEITQNFRTNYFNSLRLNRVSTDLSEQIESSSVSGSIAPREKKSLKGERQKSPEQD